MVWYIELYTYVTEKQTILSHFTLFIFVFISYHQDGTTGSVSGYINHRQLEYNIGNILEVHAY